ncbi:MAG: MFS transporter [Candidatus Baltobacteraceae bacterium]|jgi:sugar phosphate permease
MTKTPPLRIGRMHYAWIVATLVFAVLIVVAGIRATPGVLMVPMERSLGWSAATVSAAAGLNIALYGLTGPFAAALMQTLGVRRTMLLGLSLLACAVAAGGFAREPWELILAWGVFAGIGVGTLAMVLAATVANRWFAARRGLVLGWLTAATATGQLVFLPLLATVAVAAGWRTATWLVAGVAAAIVVPVALLMRDRPADVGLLPYGASAPPAAASSARNPLTVAFASLGRASRNPAFWVLAGTFFICGASTNGLIGTHFIPACGDHGIPEVRAATLLAAMGIFDLVGTTASGWLSDRVDNRLLLGVYYGLRGLSLVFLPQALDASFVGLSAFTVFYGLDWIATVPPTVRLATQAFGLDEGPVVFGWIAASHQLGAGATAFAAGWMRTALGSYSLAFDISGTLCLIAALAIVLLRPTRTTVPVALAEPAS